MTDRSHLTPVPITDKRGRSTTVYRSLAGKGVPKSAASAVPAPALPPAAAGTPLPEVTRRAPRELAAFEKAVIATLARNGGQPELSPEGWGRVGAKTQAAASLAMDLIDSGVFTTETVADLLDIADGGRVGDRTSDVLRIAARLWPHGAERKPDARWILRLSYAVGALSRYRNTNTPRIATVDELEADAAVVQFVMHAANDDTLTAGEYSGPKWAMPRTIRNPHLEALLRERPEDLDRITEYIQERGMDPENAQAVVDLREWLNSDAPAIGDGWL